MAALVVASAIVVVPLPRAGAQVDEPTVTFIEAPRAGQILDATFPVKVRVSANLLEAVSVSLTGADGSVDLGTFGSWTTADMVTGVVLSGSLDVPDIDDDIPANGYYTLRATAVSTAGNAAIATIGHLVIAIAPSIPALSVVDDNETIVISTAVDCPIPPDETALIQRSVNGGPFATIATIKDGDSYNDTNPPAGVPPSYQVIGSRPSVISSSPLLSAPSFPEAPLPSPPEGLPCTGSNTPTLNMVALNHLVSAPTTQTSTTHQITVPTTTEATAVTPRTSAVAAGPLFVGGSAKPKPTAIGVVVAAAAVAALLVLGLVALALNHRRRQPPSPRRG